MKVRFAALLVLLTVIAVGLAFSQKNPACSDHASASKASCCTKGAKASMTSADKNSADKTALVEVSDKVTTAKDSKDCPSMKECAQHASMKDCPMHGAAMKTAMKSGGKDCCKAGAKSAAMKQKISSAKKSTNEAKGTN